MEKLKLFLLKFLYAILKWLYCVRAYFALSWRVVPNPKGFIFILRTPLFGLCYRKCYPMLIADSVGYGWDIALWPRSIIFNLKEGESMYRFQYDRTAIVPVKFLLRPS